MLKRKNKTEEILEDTVEEMKDDSLDEVDADAVSVEDESEDELYENEIDEDNEEDQPVKKSGVGKKLGIACGVFIGILAAVYFGFAFYFNSHFLFNTTINGNDFALKNVSQVEDYMKQQVSDYTLTLKESDGDTEKIAGSEIKFEYVPNDELTQMVKDQDNILWIKSLWDKPVIEAKIGVKYDETSFNAKISGLKCMAEENQVASVDAYPEFKDTEFVIIPEVVGTQIDTEKFQTAVTDAIQGFNDTLVLSDAGVYLVPRFVSDSPEVIAAKDEMNSYLGANITYDLNPYTEVVDASVISQWVTVDGDMNVTFNEESVSEFVASLAEKYDTRGKAREFTTATGNVVTVEGGDYGWRLDQEAEYDALISNIQNAETITREPEYRNLAASHDTMDVGTTYAEVDLTNQHMYFIQDGQVVMDCDVVTGKPSNGHATPQGTYSLTYKKKDAVLKGEIQPNGEREYETPVAYWMPFNGGIGFHDATWQSSFGGSRYLTNGSHGCINMPLSKAAELFELIPDQCPVVCHY